MIISYIFPILVVALSPRPLVTGLFCLHDCLILGLILASFAAVASGVTDLLMGLKEFHVTAPAPPPSSSPPAPPSDLQIVTQLLTLNQGSLNAVQHSPLLGAIRVMFRFVMILILQDFVVFRVDFLQ